MITDVNAAISPLVDLDNSKLITREIRDRLYIKFL